MPLDAELHDLKLDAGYSRLTGEYKGSISYDRGRVASRQIEPIEHAVQAQFTASRTVFAVSPLTITSGASRLSANARLTNYANPDIDGKYDGNLFTSELANALKLASMPVGEVALDGTFGYHAKTQQSFLAGLSINGQMHSGKLTLRTTQGTLVASALRARYELKDANVRVDGLVAEILGGRTKASWEMLRADSSSPSSRLKFSLKGVSLTNASDALGPRDLNKLRLAGTTNLDIQAAWSGPVQNAIAHARLAVSNPEHAIAASSSIPVNGLVQVDYDGPRNKISFAQSYLQTSSTKITISGALDSRGRANSDIDVVATTGDLREVASLASLVENTFRPPGHPPIVIPNLQGAAPLALALPVPLTIREFKASCQCTTWRLIEATGSHSPSIWKPTLRKSRFKTASSLVIRAGKLLSAVAPACRTGRSKRTAPFHYKLPSLTFLSRMHKK